MHMHSKYSSSSQAKPVLPYPESAPHSDTGTRSGDWSHSRTRQCAPAALHDFTIRGRYQQLQAVLLSSELEAETLVLLLVLVALVLVTLVLVALAAERRRVELIWRVE